MTQLNPRISIIVPSFNQGRYIEKTILSVLFQEYENWELVIQDACSDDETESVCMKYAEADSRIRFFREKDKGFADGVNKALAKTTGTIGAIQSSDDFYAHENVFSEVVANFNLHPELKLVTTGSRMVDEKYEFIDTPTDSRKCGFIDPIDAFRLLDHFAQGSTFFSISRVKEIGGLRSEYDMVADTDLWVRLATYSPICKNALLRVGGTWSYLIMHLEQRSADQTKFRMGRCYLYIEFLNDPRMDVPLSLRHESVKGHLTEAFYYLLFKRKSTNLVEELYHKQTGNPIPWKWSIKKYLTKIPFIHSIYFKGFMDNDSAFLLSNDRAGNALWFRKTNHNHLSPSTSEQV